MTGGPHIIVHEDDYWSNTKHGDRRLTWAELAESQRDQIARLERFAQVLNDLDRCEHGRHQGDICSSCNGPSKGNPFLPDGWGGTAREPGTPELRQIGFGMDGRPIVVPPRTVKADPAAWRMSIPEGLRSDMLEEMR